MSACPLRLAAFAAVAVLVAAPAEAQTPMVPSTTDFLAAAAHSDRFEMLEARTALTQTRDPRISAFAGQMIAEHMRTRRTLQQAALTSNMGPLPQGLDGDQQRLLGALQSQRGSDFDKTYAKQQVLAHREALIVQQVYAADGADPHIQSAARSAVPVIQHHLEMARKLRMDIGD